MKRWIALLLAAVLLGLIGCQDSGSGAGKAPKLWVTYEEASDSVVNEEGHEIFAYSYQQPVLGGSSDALHMINTKLGDTTASFLYGSGGVSEMTEQAKRDWKEVWFSSYALHREVRMARLDSQVASFRYSDYVYNGGVHGYTAEYGMSYDMVSGQQLDFADLTDNEWGLKEVCRQHITAYLASDDFPHKDGLMSGYEKYLDIVLDNWVLTEDGLQFIAQPYIISTYAMGTLRITVPYEKLVHILHKRWLPDESGRGGGAVTLGQGNDRSAAAASFVVDGAGEKLMLRVSGTVYDFSVERAGFYPNGGTTTFFSDKQLLYIPQMEDTAIGLQIVVPEGIPSALLRYRDADGEEQLYLIGYNGRDGGAALTEPESFMEE